MRQYAMRDFYPENCPERVFNTWRGYAVEVAFSGTRGRSGVKTKSGLGLASKR